MRLYTVYSFVSYSSTEYEYAGGEKRDRVDF